MDAEQITTDAGPVDSTPDTGDTMHSEMAATFDRMEGGESNTPSAPNTSPEPTAEEAYQQIHGLLDSVSKSLGDLPQETRDHFRKATEPVPLPQAWAADKAQLWSQLDRATQEYVSTREQEAHNKITELGRLAKQPGADVGEVFEGFRSQGLVPTGEDGKPLSAPQVIESALAFDQQLRQSPAEAIAALANAHGVNLLELASVQGHQQVDPNQIRQEAYAEWQQALAQQQAQQQQQEYAARTQWLVSEIDQFTNGKDYWPKIEQEVIHQAGVLKSMNPAKAASDPLGLLRDAEKRALKQLGIDPDATSKAAEAKRKADQAKRLASMNVGKSSLGRAVSANQSWEETMADAYDRATNHRR
jgi:hypothetical protein